MSFRRLRRLAGLTESIADTPETNAEIERRLDGLEPALRTPVLDALEVLKMAGDSGLTLSDWAATIRQMHGDSEMPMADILKAAVRQFSIVVKKLAPKTYGWSVAASSDDETFDPAQEAAVGAQVGLTQQALALMRSMPSFTARSLAERLVATGQIAPPHAAGFVDHLIQNFQSMLIKTGDQYQLKSEAPTTRAGTMQSFRDIVNNPKPL